MSLESVFATLRKSLSSPGQKSWAEIQQVLAKREGQADYSLVREFVLEHLQEWSSEQICTLPSDAGADAVFPQDGLFFLRAYRIGLPEDSFQFQALQKAEERLEKGEIQLAQIWKPAPVDENLLWQVEERFGMEIPQDVRDFYRVSDGFGLAFFEKNGSEHFVEESARAWQYNRPEVPAVHRENSKAFYLKQHQLDWYHPHYDVFFCFPSVSDVFFPNGEMEVHDLHMEEDEFIHTRVFSFMHTDSHAFCFPTRDQLEEGRTEYDNAWVIGYGNDHWIAYDDAHYIHFSQYLKNRLFKEMGVGEEGFTNSVYYIAGEEAFREIPAAAFDEFPASKDEPFEGTEEEIYEWIRQFR